MRLVVLGLLLDLGGCGGNSPGVPDARAVDAPIDAVVNADDGTPMRLPCTGQFGTALSTVYGRLDGILVAIVQPGNGGCNADPDHLHLQLKVNGAIYDVAVNVGTTAVPDVHTTTRELWLPTWSEGWHPGVHEDYPSLGVHAADIPLGTPTQVASAITADLATANHISVFATGYGADGVHLVHRTNGSRDGMIVTRPLSSPAHARLFSFSTQTF
ncbi:MAG: hypothetical protein NT062_20315 [Proteobacteria bacterium]|nr:hypothetical protein [Pseudomonadota bacterium]